jgi:hypothetical protein
MVLIPKHVVLDGYIFLLIYVTVGMQCDSYPAPNTVFISPNLGTRCHLDSRIGILKAFLIS